eukprot:COSAG01_NODE_6117_length_3842_cov_4.674860_2_plen_155_part_00
MRCKYLGPGHRRHHHPCGGGGADGEEEGASEPLAPAAEPGRRHEEDAEPAAADTAAGRGLRLSLPHCAAEAGLPCLRALWSPDPLGEAGPYQPLPADALSLDRPNDDASAATANAPRPLRRQPSVTVRLSQPVRTIWLVIGSPCPPSARHGAPI